MLSENIFKTRIKNVRKKKGSPSSMMLRLIGSLPSRELCKKRTSRSRTVSVLNDAMN